MPDINGGLHNGMVDVSFVNLKHVENNAKKEVLTTGVLSIFPLLLSSCFIVGFETLISIEDYVNAGSW